MTMVDSKCDVCGVGEAIGVASTSMPMSVAYCCECAQRGADPEIVFICFYDDFGNDFAAFGAPDELLTFSGGRYMTYREWAMLRDAAGIKPQQYPEDPNADNTV